MGGNPDKTGSVVARKLIETCKEFKLTIDIVRATGRTLLGRVREPLTYGICTCACVCLYVGGADQRDRCRWLRVYRCTFHSADTCWSPLVLADSDECVRVVGGDGMQYEEFSLMLND